MGCPGILVSLDRFIVHRRHPLAIRGGNPAIDGIT
jgi:hypothetical protein